MPPFESTPPAPSSCPSLASRPLIACLLPVLLLAAACDRTGDGDGQANAAAASAIAANAAAAADANAATADEVQPGSGGIAAPAAIAPRQFDRSHAGEAAPTLGFDGPDGKPTTLAAFRGKPVLVNLWATWCAPCVKELPTLDTLATRDRATLQVVTLSQDMQPDKAAAFFAQRRFATLKVYTDPKLAWLTALGGANLPMSILYDAGGREVWRTAGDRDWSDADAAKAIAAA